MTAATDDIVKLLSCLLIGLQVMRSQRELLGRFVICYKANWSAELHPVADASFLHPALDVMRQDFTRGITRDRFAKMLLERIIWILNRMSMTHMLIYY